MAITAPDNRITTYNPVVPTTEFPAQFPVFDNHDVKVFVDGEERNDFAPSATYVEGISSDFKAVFAVGVTGKVEVVGARDPHRTNRFGNGPLPTRDFNLALDTLEAESQEARRDIDRSHKAPFGEAGGIFSAQDIGDAQENAAIAAEAAEAAAASAAAASASANGAWNFSTEALFTAANIPGSVNAVRAAGYYAVGDGGGHLKVRIATPSPIYAWHKQSADGAWWEAKPEFANARALGAAGNGVTNDTTAVIATIARFGNAVLIDGDYLLTSGGVDLRLLSGKGRVLLTTGGVLTADKLPDRGDIGQRYFTEIKNTTLNSVSQSIAVFKDKLYRSQERNAPTNSYAYDTTVDITQYDLPAGNGRSRTTIDYTSDATTQTQNYVVTVQGLGHGDGIAFLTLGGVDYLYGKCSAPAGSIDPPAEATGFVKFPWLGASTALEPAGAVFYRNLQGVKNGNFGMSSDGRYVMWVYRDVDAAGVISGGDSSVTTYRVCVHDRAKIETAGSANAHTVVPYAKFVVTPNLQTDTIYAEAGIASDGKYIYVTFSGARVVGKTFLYVYTMDGDLVKSIVTSGIRAEDVSVYSKGKSGYLPAFYETEGLCVYGDKLLTSSRYLFATGSPVVTYPLTGENFVYIGTSPASGNLPTNVGFWAPTKAAATHGNYNPATVYTRGTIVFHHYVTAYVTGGVYGAEEFALDVDPYGHPYVQPAFNGMVSSRSDYTINYNLLNSRKMFGIAAFRINGEFFFYNAALQVTGAHSLTDGFKVIVSDNKEDVRLQNAGGLANSAAIILATSTHGSFPNSVLMYTGLAISVLASQLPVSSHTGTFVLPSTTRKHWVW